ncbi:MAG: aldehyde dehydrogenase family protein [Planctomycetes bacterium]|nr:aldehyde dehydrogenase family protein [Planctomycetota bacterium]
MTSLTIRNPATGKVIQEVPVTPAEEVARAVERARTAQSGWAARTTRERGAALIRFRNAIRDHAEELVESIVRETGKVPQEALMMEILGTTDLITYFARRASRILRPRRIGIHFYPTRQSTLHYVPRGVIGILSPWNFPLAIPIGQASMALMAGNAVVLKPSELTPLVALQAKRLYDQAGLPPDLFQVVTGDASTGAALVRSPVNQVFFTGSVAAGKKVAAVCAERLVPVVLELGGKAPALVFEDADLERTAAALAWGAFANAGQVCASVERVYVHEGVHDALAGALAREVKALRVGPPGRDVDVGSMTKPQQIERVAQLVDGAVRDGAKVLCGGRRREGPGLFYEPTLLDECPKDSEILRNEIFGPVLPIASFRSEEEAIELANQSNLGLLAYVFTEDRARGQRVARRIEAGTVMVNDVLSTFAFPETPWFGLKESGLGLVHSDEGLKQMCQVRHVHDERFRPFRKELWWYPYSTRKLERFFRAYRWLYTWLYR